MPQIIDYQGKSDRELLVELVVQGNSSVKQGGEIVHHLEQLNGSKADHEKRIGFVERTQKECPYDPAKSYAELPPWMRSPWKVGGAGTGMIALMTVACRVAEKLIGG